MELSTWAPTDRLIQWVGDANKRMETLVSDFSADDDRWLGPYLPIVNPPIWEIAHAAWFAEWFILRQLHGRDPLRPTGDAFYDSGKVPHITRWQLAFPSPSETLDYLKRVADGLIDVVENNRGLDSTDYFCAYAVSHYDAHNEALTYTRQTLGWGEPTWSPNQATENGALTNGAAAEVIDTDITVDAQDTVLGGSRLQPFVMDNEKWAHPAGVKPFAMAATPVTMAQYARFVDDGGYGQRSCWSAEGWAWKQTAGANQPVYWRKADGGWEHRRFDHWLDVESHANHPMVHVSWWEVEAYCTWAGRRLPTEAEWEIAATTGPTGERQPWFPWGSRDPEPGEAALDANTVGTVPVTAHSAGDGPWGHRQLIGNVWEWTSSVFEPFPHFEPDAYRDNSEPWFGSRRVLKGGSWATENRYVRSTYRNYFTPDRQDVIAGFRTCAVD